MKRFVVLAGIALLAACSQNEEAAAPEAVASEEMPVDAGATPAVAEATPGVNDVTRPDGTKLVSTLNADGTYERDYGETVEKGKWVSRGGQTCFDPEGEAAESCNTRGPAAADGSFESTNPETGVSKVVPRP